MSRRCPRGGSHVWPHVGKVYDDGRCLKCGAPKPDATGWAPLRTDVLWRMPWVISYRPMPTFPIAVVMVAKWPSFDLMVTVTEEQLRAMPSYDVRSFGHQMERRLKRMHTWLCMPGHEV